MRETKGFELKVGIFIFIGLIVLLIIIFSIGDISFFEQGYQIKAVFGFANGLAESAPVRLAGVDVGEVHKINIFRDNYTGKTKVEVIAWVKKDVRIEKDATAIINTLGLLGEKYLEIFPGSPGSKALEEGGILIGKDPVPISDVTEKMGELAESATVIINRLKNGEGTIGKLLTEEKIYNDLEALVADLRAHPWKLMKVGREVRKDEKGAPVAPAAAGNKGVIGGRQ